MYDNIESLPVVVIEGKQYRRGVDVCLNQSCKNLNDLEKCKPKKKGLCDNCYMNLFNAIRRANKNASEENKIDFEDCAKKGLCLHTRKKSGRQRGKMNELDPVIAQIVSEKSIKKDPFINDLLSLASTGGDAKKDEEQGIRAMNSKDFDSARTHQDTNIDNLLEASDER